MEDSQWVSRCFCTSSIIYSVLTHTFIYFQHLKNSHRLLLVICIYLVSLFIQFVLVNCQLIFVNSQNK